MTNALQPFGEDDRDDRIEQVRVAAAALKASGNTSAILNPNKTTADSIFNMFNDYEPLGYKLPFEILDYIELIARYNPDYSQAVGNIKTLANSGHDLFVDTRSTRRQERLKARLEEKARTIQGRHGGIDGLIEKLLDQAATYGAMCGEWVLSENLDDVVDFADLNPKSIRFFWEPEENGWAPYQKVTKLQADEAAKSGQKIRGTCVKLNQTTFHYYAFDAAPNSPYGTPPFIAALANISIQRDMVFNMAQIVKKVGLLGIIDLSVEQLKKSPGETADEFIARATAFLTQYKAVAEDMVRDGGIIHFDDVTVQTTNVAGNAAGATNIFKQNEELIFSGLKSMPSVQGRSYSTTETYAGVAYDIIIRNTRKYQRSVKRMIEAGYWLMATVWGDQPDKIRLMFNENKSLHRLEEAQAERQEIINDIIFWIAGMLDQTSFGQRHGFSSPKRPMDDVPDDLKAFASAAAKVGGSTSQNKGALPPAHPLNDDEDEGDEE